MKTYKRMTYRTRLRIEALYNYSRFNAVRIAEELGYSHQAIYAELKRGFFMKRNSDWTETKQYSADRAQRAADFQSAAKGVSPKIGKDYTFVTVIEDLILRRKLSPAAALATIRREKIPVDTHICVRTLYSYIEKGYFPHITMKNLPYKGTRKKARRSVGKAVTLPRGTSIEARPPQVLRRDIFGHWEMDSVIGTATGGNTLLVLTERKTRFELIFKSKNKTAAATVSVLNRLEKRLGTRRFRQVFKSITCDNGCEFADYPGMELSMRGNSQRTSVFFCHPYCSSERGSNENQNRIIRRFIAKGTPIRHYSDAEIAATNDYLNDLPRQIFGWQTARERFISELSALGIKKFS